MVGPVIVERITQTSETRLSCSAFFQHWNIPNSFFERKKNFEYIYARFWAVK
jgi:hypothetical protein